MSAVHSRTSHILIVLFLTVPLCVHAQAVVRDLGIPITTPNRISYKTASEFGPGKRDLLCWTTTAESGGHFAALDLKTRRFIVKPLGSLEAYPIVYGSDGRVYVGNTDGYVWVWNPEDDSWGRAGERMFAQPGVSLNHVRVLCEGPDGWLYGGSVYGTRARLKMSTGTVEPLPMLPDSGHWYISAAATLPGGRIAFGTGYNARIYIYDPRQRKDVAQWMPDEFSRDGFCFNILPGRRIVYATHFPSGRRVAFSSKGKYLGILPWPEHKSEALWSHWNHSSGYGSAIDFYVNDRTDEAFTYDGTVVHSYHPGTKRRYTVSSPDSLQLGRAISLALEYEVTSDCRVIQTDRTRKTIIGEIKPKMPEVERSIFSLTIGPDSALYGGAYQSTMLFRFDPKTERMTVLGDHHPGWSGETFSYINRGDELITASYTNGAVVAYNPFKKWDCRPFAMHNPRLIGFFGQYVYRPLSLCLDNNGGIWGVGPAGWGTTGGGIARIDGQSGRVISHHLEEIPHSIVKMTDDVLLVAGERSVRWWSISGDSLITQTQFPIRISQLCRADVGGQAKFFVSSGKTILIVSADEVGTLTIKDSTSVEFDVSRMIPHRSKIVYAGPKGIGIFSPLTNDHHVITDEGVSLPYAIAASDNTIFFGKNGTLRSVNY